MYAIDDATAILLGIVSILFLIFLIVVCMVNIIAMWKLFSKAGEKGWKSLIPFYRRYIYYKIAWKGSMYWLVFPFTLFMILSLFLPLLLMDSSAVYQAAVVVLSSVMMILGTLAGTAGMIHNVQLSKAFGKKATFAIGLMLLYPIFFWILALGRARYAGPQE